MPKLYQLTIQTISINEELLPLSARVSPLCLSHINTAIVNISYTARWGLSLLKVTVIKQPILNVSILP